jgi:hypothetical protein
MPTATLDVPFLNYRRRILRHEAALLMDRWQRALSRISGAADRGLAQGLHRMRAGRGFARLGYARFVDWARERIGLAERTAHELAQLGGRLDRLPALDAALGQGKLSWTAAALVARVAGLEDHERWVRMAHELPVRQLREQVRRELERRQGTGTDPPARDDDVDPDALVPGEHDADPKVRVRVAARREVAWLWYAAVELCEQVAGAPLPGDEAAEYLFADFLSGAAPANVRSGVEHDPPVALGEGAAPEVTPAAAANVRSVESGWALVGDGAATAGLPGWAADEVRRVVRQVASRKDVRRWIEAASTDPPRDPFQLDAWLRALMDAKRGVDLDLGRLLRCFVHLGLARHLGLTGLGAYCEERLGLSPRHARELVALDRKLVLRPRVEQAVRKGRIGTVAAWLVCRVASDVRSERAWLERAARVTVLRLREEVAWVEREASLRGWRRPWMPPHPARLPSILEEVAAELVIPAHHHQRQQQQRRTSAAGNEAQREGPRVCVGFWMRRSALHLRDEARQALGEANPGRRVRDEDVLLSVAAAFLETHLPAWLREVRHGDPVAVRERFRCAIPGCTSRGGSAHHIRFRSQGGSDEMSNLVFVCFAHHIEGIHRGRLRVHGRAPDRLVVELGIRPDGTATETFVGGERMMETAGAAKPARTASADLRGAGRETNRYRRRDSECARATGSSGSAAASPGAGVAGVCVA